MNQTQYKFNKTFVSQGQQFHMNFLQDKGQLLILDKNGEIYYEQVYQYLINENLLKKFKGFKRFVTVIYMSLLLGYFTTSKLNKQEITVELYENWEHKQKCQKGQAEPMAVFQFLMMTEYWKKKMTKQMGK